MVQYEVKTTERYYWLFELQHPHGLGCLTVFTPIQDVEGFSLKIFLKRAEGILSELSKKPVMQSQEQHRNGAQPEVQLEFMLRLL